MMPARAIGLATLLAATGPWALAPVAHADAPTYVHVVKRDGRPEAPMSLNLGRYLCLFVTTW